MYFFNENYLIQEEENDLNVAWLQLDREGMLPLETLEML